MLVRLGTEIVASKTYYNRNELYQAGTPRFFETPH